MEYSKNVQNSITFLYTCIELSEKEIRKFNKQENTQKQTKKVNISLTETQAHFVRN